MWLGVVMKHQTLAVAAGFERFARQTRRVEFLSQMERVVAWAELVALIEPHYPKADNGSPPVGLERMLRIYFLQQWFNLSDPAVEDALYDSLTMRALVGIDLGREPVPDEITVCKFRHLLERHGLGKQWHFGMKAHVGVDAGTKLIHSATATAANVADSRVLPELLHGEETEVWATRPVRARPRSSGSVPPRPKIVSTGATAPGESAIPKSAKRTARSPEPVRGSSTSSLSSNCASASPRFATEACSRTQTACSRVQTIPNFRWAFRRGRRREC